MGYLQTILEMTGAFYVGGAIASFAFLSSVDMMEGSPLWRKRDSALASLLWPIAAAMAVIIGRKEGKTRP